MNSDLDHSNWTDVDIQVDLERLNEMLLASQHHMFCLILLITPLSSSSSLCPTFHPSLSKLKLKVLTSVGGVWADLLLTSNIYLANISTCLQSWAPMHNSLPKLPVPAYISSSIYNTYPCEICAHQEVFRNAPTPTNVLLSWILQKELVCCLHCCRPASPLSYLPPSSH